MERGKTLASAGSASPLPQLLCLSLHKLDKIRVLNLSATSIAPLRTAIASSWKYGIQSEGLHGISYQFKLRGRPWEGNGEQANAARRLMAGVFGFLLQQGWVLTVATDLSRRKSDKDTFYFKQGSHPNPNVGVCAMSFNYADTIRVISGPQEVAQVVRSCIQNFWHRGLQRERLYYGEPEFKLLGNPWTGSGAERMRSQMFVGQMIEALDRAGWQIYASINISKGKHGPDSPSDELHSWILKSKSPSPQSPAHAQKEVSYNW